MNNLVSHKIGPNLNVLVERADAGASPPTVAEALRETIAAALPEFERWAPTAASNQSVIGHLAQASTREERARVLAHRAANQANTGIPPNREVERVERAHTIINTLFASFYGAPRGINDATAAEALRDIVSRAESFEKKRRGDRDRAIAAALMTELPAIYERVQRGELEEPEQAALVKDLLLRTHLLPSDPTLLERVLEELVVETCFINEALDLPLPGSAKATTRKGNGAVETAQYTLSVALDVLGVQWPHRRGKLMDLRKMSDQAKLLALAPGSFGSRLGSVEVMGYAQRAALCSKRGVVTPPSRPRAASRTRGKA